MARKADLMGIGMPPLQAALTATDPVVITSNAAASFASALAIGGTQYLTCVTSAGASSGGFMLLPTVGGFSGCLLGDDFIINNQAGVTITVCSSSGTTISVSGTNVAGGTGFSMSAHITCTFYPITVSSWLGLHGT